MRHVPLAAPARGDRDGPVYAPRAPGDTALYRLVQEQLDALVEHAAATYERGLPRYVERAFRAYLDCGIFAHGFLRWHCAGGP